MAGRAGAAPAAAAHPQCAGARAALSRRRRLHTGAGPAAKDAAALAGAGGGLLMREKDGRYYAATGSKGYRWLESEMVKELSKEDSIDRSYYDKLVDDAVETISKYGDFEWFVSDDPYIPKPRLEDFINIPEDADEELPFN